jgi:hypothetical protein
MSKPWVMGEKEYAGTFDEAEHPRAEDGKWTDAGGGGLKGIKESMRKAVVESKSSLNWERVGKETGAVHALVGKSGRGPGGATHDIYIAELPKGKYLAEIGRYGPTGSLFSGPGRGVTASAEMPSASEAISWATVESKRRGIL